MEFLLGIGSIVIGLGLILFGHSNSSILSTGMVFLICGILDLITIKL